MRIEMALGQLEGVARSLGSTRGDSETMAAELRRQAQRSVDAGGSGDVYQQVYAATRLLDQQATDLDHTRRDLLGRIDVARALLASSYSGPALLVGIAHALGGAAARQLTPSRVNWLQAQSRYARQQFVRAGLTRPDVIGHALAGGYEAWADTMDDLSHIPGWKRAARGRWRSIGRVFRGLGIAVTATAEYVDLSQRGDLTTTQVVGATALRTAFVEVGAFAAGTVAASACAAVTAPVSATVAGLAVTVPVCAAVGLAAGAGAGAVLDRVYEGKQEEVLRDLGEWQQDPGTVHWEQPRWGTR